MKSDDLSGLILSTLKRNILVSIFILVGFIFLSIGLIQLFITPKEDIQFISGDQTVSGSTPDAVRDSLVDVSGAVISPGVYKFKSNARIQDALVAAGGLSSDADRDFVSRAINLASPLKDGMKIYIPKLGSNNMGAAQTGDSMVVLGSSTVVGLNTASSEELDSLPGIGKVTAQKIIEGRPYSALEELVDRKIVSTKVYNGIKDKIGL